MTARNARFARSRDLRNLRRPPYGLFLGYHGLWSRPLLSDTPGHALVVAPTRAGKGVGLLMQNALAWPSSMIILDPKGEFRQKTLHWRAHYQECFTWGPTTFSTRWNPLAEIAATPPDTRMEQAMHLARAFASGSASGSPAASGDSFWTTEAASFLAHAFLWAATGTGQPATLAHVYDLLNRPDDLARLHDALRHSPEPQLASWAQAHTSQTDSVASSILATARSYLRSFASGPVRDATAAAEFGYSNLLAPGTTLYLHASAADFTTHGPLLVAFLEGFISRALATTDALTEPLLLLLDEFSLLPALPSLRTLLTLSAGYHIRLLVVLQNLSQVSPDVRDILLSNTYDQVFFAARDPATLEHLTKRLGTVYRKAISRSTGKSGTSRSESERRDDLMASHQIRAMKKSLLFHGNAAPARVTLRPYFKDKRFTPRLGDVLPPTPTPYRPPDLADLLPDDVDMHASDATPPPDADASDEFDDLDTLFEAPDDD